MKKDLKTKVRIILYIRTCLWIIALVSTVYWMYYSAKLHANGIYEPAEYSPLMRPVLYTCLGIAIVAVCISFALHTVSKRIKRDMK